VQPSGLDFYTSRELIDELMRRKTFLGVVVQAREEMKSPDWDGERTFTVHFNGNLEAEEAGRLLDAVAGHLDRMYD
jgi:hypothetical protein